MHQRRFGIREKSKIGLCGLPRDLEEARSAFRRGEHLAAIDIYEQLAAAYKGEQTAILAELYDRYLELPQRDRYHLYQSRHFDFGIVPGDKVLDIGSGHIPFPLATHLSDIALTDHSVGRGGAPFRYVEGKPVYECSVEALPFEDQEFDFVYCSHVLEHTRDPEAACRELMRVAKRGYIETPTRAKDIFLSSARESNHTRGVELVDGRLVFSDYGEKEIDGLGCGILQAMHGAPQTEREKAFAALIWLKAEVVNTMLLWDGSFQFEVRRPCPVPGAGAGAAAEAGSAGPLLTFLQVHTFYPAYLEEFYLKTPGLGQQGFDEQMNALVRDGFSGIHIFAPYLRDLGYEPHFVVANNDKSQAMWLHEQGIDYRDNGDWIRDVVRMQVEAIRPDVLYLSDPINFDARFLSTLSYLPKVVLGWRAANIAAGTDWTNFDVMLSSLGSLREVSLKLGAKGAEHFFPGFPSWMKQATHGEPLFDVVFSGSWTTEQHPRRNAYIVELARAAARGEFSLALYLNAPPELLPPEVQRFNKGARFGVAMHEALKSGRIVVDARGILEYREPETGAVTDLAKRETANMRIFEVTGSGALLLAEAHENLKAYFEPGAEIETFGDEKELLAKIAYYLLHPERREAIARSGQERCLKEYSMERRAAELDRIIRRHLPQTPSATQETPAALKARAEAHLEAGRVKEAFDLLVRAKGLKDPCQGVDLVRAHCFLKLGEPLGAVEALKEELRYFPGTAEAAALLAELRTRVPDSSCGTECPEFRTVLEAIRPYTMLSEERLYSLYRLARKVCEEDLPGNFVECGVAAGGSSALLAFVIKRYSRQPRRLFSFDSFSGMPKPTELDSHDGIDAEATGWGTGTCAATEESLREICAKLDVSEIVTPVQGYFEETLPRVKDWVGMVALLHLDGDWYSSTKAILDNLYDRLVNDALLQVDDYGYWDGCRKAIHEFEAARGIRFAINGIDGTGVWFQKPDRFPANRAIAGELLHDFESDDPARKGVTSQMSVNERFQLYWALRNVVPQGQGMMRFIEIGSYSGASLVLTHQALTRRGIRFQGVTVEPGGTPQFHEIVKLLADDVVHLPLFSHEAAKRLATMLDPSRLPQFIFVDGDHTYPGVRQDILDFYPLLAPGGVMMFHDYLPPLNEKNRDFILHHHGNQEPGIRQAVEELMVGTYRCEELELPLLYPSDPTQTQAQLPIIPGVFSTVRAYRKPA